MIIVCGLIMEKTDRKIIPTFLGMVLATAVAYLFGTIWFVIQAKATVVYALTVCVFPFIPFDLVKIVIAIGLGKAVRTALLKNNLIEAE